MSQLSSLCKQTSAFTLFSRRVIAFCTANLSLQPQQRACLAEWMKGMSKKGTAEKRKEQQRKERAVTKKGSEEEFSLLSQKY